MFHNTNDRRDFLKKLTIAGAASLTAPSVFAAPEGKKKITIKEGDIILFQGDSITDTGRKKDPKDAAVPNVPSTLGTGYAMLAAAELLHNGAGKNLKIYNRGISGNKVYQLADRWEVDCLELKPTILSILIGVNDFWHKLNGTYDGTVEKYTNDFKQLLARTKDKLPDVQLIVGEPFAVNKVKAVTDNWFPAFYDYKNAAKEVAESFGATIIPYQTVFDKAEKKAPGSYWTTDGVHPTLAGHKLMANAWLQAVKL